MTALMTREHWGQWAAIAVTIVVSAALATWAIFSQISNFHEQDAKLIAYYHDLDSKVMTDLHEKDMTAISDMNSRYMQALADLSARMSTQEAKAAAMADIEQRDHADQTSFQAETRSGLGTIISQLGSLQASAGKDQRSR